MAPTTIAPISQALVQTLRANTSIWAYSPSTGGKVSGPHEGIAPQKAKYPFVVYDVHYAPMEYLWDSIIQTPGFDVFVYAENSVDAKNIDQLVFAALQDAALSVTGQTTLLCRRVLSLSTPDIDEEGKRIYQAGGTYEVWTAQPR